MFIDDGGGDWTEQYHELVLEIGSVSGLHDLKDVTSARRRNHLNEDGGSLSEFDNGEGSPVRSQDRRPPTTLVFIHFSS